VTLGYGFAGEQIIGSGHGTSPDSQKKRFTGRKSAPF
jgi:hypothetical protein